MKTVVNLIELKKKGSVKIVERSDAKDQAYISGLTLFMDQFARVVFSKRPDLIELILRILIDNPDLEIEQMQLQKEFNQIAGGRSVRLDVFAVDREGNVYDLELQRRGKIDYARIQIYEASILLALSEEGKEFSDNPHISIIFLHEHDPKGDGEEMYRIDPVLRHSKERVDSRTDVMFVNGDSTQDTPVGKLVHDLKCADPDEMYYSEIAEAVRYFKTSQEEVLKMKTALDELLEEVREETRKETRKEMRKEARKEARKEILQDVQNVLQVLGVAPEIIAQVMALADIRTPSVNG